MRDLNPGMMETVFDGSRLLPKGYRLRLPYDGSVPIETASQLFMAAYEKMPSEAKHEKQLKGGKYARRGR